MTKESYLLILEPHFDDKYIKPIIKPYYGSIQELYEACDCSTYDIRDATRYFPYMNLKQGLLIVCDDYGKLDNKEPVLPVVNTDGDIIDLFVGKVAFIISEYDASGERTGKDRGLTRKEVTEVVEEVRSYLNSFTKFPKLRVQG